MFDIEKEIKAVQELKRGNQEIAIFIDDYVTMMVGNPCACVQLGEAAGEFEAEGRTIEEAFTKMKIKLSGVQ